MTDIISRTITPNPPADFTPSMGNYQTLQPFRYWCQKVLPLVYDDSLSYYELLCKVVDYLNITMQDVETLHCDVNKLHKAYERLQRYVNDYFSSLDVQKEINNKLDSMAKDGTLTELISKYIDPLINEQNKKIGVLEERMNTFTMLPSGSTTADAELIDIRVPASGFNGGKAYPTAGDAVRGQISALNGDLSYFKDTTGYVLKPEYSVHKEKLPLGTFLNLGTAVSEHRYAIVYTPVFDTPVSISVMDDNSNLHGTLDGQTYYSTITASVNGTIRFITQSDIDYPVDIFVYDTTNNNMMQEFVKNALLLVTELKFNFNGRQSVTIKSSDNEALNVIKLTGACNVGNIDVLFDDGTYNFLAWYAYTFYMNNRNPFRCEIPIGNGCNYYFNGATINGTVNDSTLPDPTIKTNCSLFGSRTNKGDYMLSNGVINARGTIYAIHDEMSGESKYNHEYENMIINYISETQENNIRKCIGGGAGRYGNVVLKNCILNSDYSHELSFHGYENVLGNVDGKITLNISDCYFKHGIQIDRLPDKEIGTVITVCNSFSSDYADYSNNNWVKYSWNNESRNN